MQFVFDVKNDKMNNAKLLTDGYLDGTDELVFALVSHLRLFVFLWI